MLHEEKQQRSPSLEQDRLYLKLAKGSARATQVVPSYADFRLGQGDPLLKATMRHDLEMASPRTRRKMLQKLQEDGEIHLIQSLSPLAGLGMNDVVHIDKHTVMSIPCIPDLTNPEETKQKTSFRLGMSDIVHLPNGETLSVPMIPTTTTSQDHEEVDCLLDHGSPLSGLGMSDIVHLGKNQILSIPCLPVTQS